MALNVAAQKVRMRADGIRGRYGRVQIGAAGRQSPRESDSHSRLTLLEEYTAIFEPCPELRPYSDITNARVSLPSILYKCKWDLGGIGSGHSVRRHAAPRQRVARK